MIILILTCGPFPRSFPIDPRFGIPQTSLWAPGLDHTGIASLFWLVACDSGASAGSPLGALLWLFSTYCASGTSQVSPSLQHHLSPGFINSPPARLVPSKRSILLGPLTQATVHQTHQRTVPLPVSPATSPCGSRASGTFGLVLRYFAEMPGALGVSVASPPHGRPTS